MTKLFLEFETFDKGRFEQLCSDFGLKPEEFEVIEEIGIKTDIRDAIQKVKEADEIYVDSSLIFNYLSPVGGAANFFNQVMWRLSQDEREPIKGKKLFFFSRKESIDWSHVRIPLLRMFFLGNNELYVSSKTGTAFEKVDVDTLE